MNIRLLLHDLVQKNGTNSVDIPMFKGPSLACIFQKIPDNHQKLVLLISLKSLNFWRWLNAGLAYILESQNIHFRVLGLTCILDLQD